MSDTNRAMQALIYDGWPVTDELRDAVALVTRVVRDDLYMAWQAGQIRDLNGAEALLNAQIEALTGQRSLTGDTTEGPSA
jgi:hypothetical protein